ncbi:MAG: PQQ-binding-like beta-propeller repeat protein [Gammaproteobacteria bacterium]|nr:PQQ-binding-like beta-propeller repeat protein [Gammaproteobacteria bacterium]
MNLRKPKRIIPLVKLGSILFFLLALMYGVSRVIEPFIKNNPMVESILAPKWAPSLLSYEVVDAPPEFKELWQFSDVFIADTTAGSNLLALNQSLYFVGSTNPNDYPMLQKLNIQTGQQEWHDGPIITHAPYIITNSQHNIILGSDKPGKMTVFDAQSGNIISERSFPITTRNIQYITTEANEIFVNISPVRFYIVDERSGTTKPFKNLNEAYPIFFIENGIVYHRELDNYLHASDEQTGNTIWKVAFDKNIIQTPVFTENIILVYTGEPPWGYIHAVDRATGDIIWHSELSVTSNVAVANDNVYYLTGNARLQAINLQTGELINAINFFPSDLEPDDFDLDSRKFYVAAAEGVIAVYFGNSRQLFIFQSMLEE